MRKIKTAIILCRFSDLAGVSPRSPQFYQEYFTEAGAGTGGAFDYWLDVTYGQVNLEGGRVFGWFTMNNHTTQELRTLPFPAGRSTLAQWGIDTAVNNGVDLSPFSVIIVVFNTGTDHGHAGGNRMVLGYNNTGWEPTFVLHEVGHCLGLDHSWSANPDTVYGDRWDMMSAMNVWTFQGYYGAPSGPGINASNLKKLGAMPASRIWTPNRNAPLQTVTLAALSEPQAPGHLMVEIPSRFLGPAQNVTYVVEFRAQQGWDKGIPNHTVLIHETRANGVSYLLSPQLVLGAGASFATPTSDFTVRLVGVDTRLRTATVEIGTRPLVEPPRCREIEREITTLRAEVADLQEELKTAPPGRKPMLAAEIRALQRQIGLLTSEGQQLGCRLN